MQADATCGRCGSVFHCGARDAEPCWCVALNVDSVTLASLATQTTGCLCPGCLGALATPGHNLPAGNAPPRDSIAG